MQAFLRAKGALVDPVAPYVYVAAADDAEVIALIEKIADGAIDAIAFTSAAQVRRLHEAAVESGRGTELAAGLKRGLVAAVGPVVAKELAGYGILNPLVPARAFAMKPLVLEIAKAISARK
jgi:uroporphyrinogen-III synthase